MAKILPSRHRNFAKVHNYDVALVRNYEFRVIMKARNYEGTDGKSKVVTMFVITNFGNYVDTSVTFANPSANRYLTLVIFFHYKISPVW